METNGEKVIKGPDWQIGRDKRSLTCLNNKMREMGSGGEGLGGITLIFFCKDLNLFKVEKICREKLLEYIVYHILKTQPKA